MWPDSPALVQPAGTGLRLARRPVAWSAVSQVAAGPLRRALGAGVTVDVVPNAVDVAWWRARSDGSLSSPYAGEVVVTSLGRLAARKRPLALLRALRTVRELVEPDVRLRLVLAGEGRQLPRLRRAAAAWGMTDWVDLPGRLTREQSRELLQRSDVYVAPADLESFGIAALEARTVGLPVVAKACSGVGEYVGHGTEGLLVGSDHEMALAVASLVRDPVMRTRIAEHNAAVPPTTTWPYAVDRTEQLYGRAAALAGRVPVLELDAAS
jgi:glycosyltransferase involved in cell wall biosynthesis